MGVRSTRSGQTTQTAFFGKETVGHPPPLFLHHNRDTDLQDTDL